MPYVAPLLFAAPLPVPATRGNIKGYNNPMVIELLLFASVAAVPADAPPRKPDGAKLEKKEPRKETPPCNPFPPLAL